MTPEVLEKANDLSAAIKHSKHRLDSLRGTLKTITEIEKNKPDTCWTPTLLLKPRASHYDRDIDCTCTVHISFLSAQYRAAVKKAECELAQAEYALCLLK